MNGVLATAAVQLGMSLVFLLLATLGLRRRDKATNAWEFGRKWAYWATLGMGAFAAINEWQASLVVFAYGVPAVALVGTIWGLLVRRMPIRGPFLDGNSKPWLAHAALLMTPMLLHGAITIGAGAGGRQPATSTEQLMAYDECVVDRSQGAASQFAVMNIKSLCKGQHPVDIDGRWLAEAGPSPWSQYQQMILERVRAGGITMKTSAQQLRDMHWSSSVQSNVHPDWQSDAQLVYVRYTNTSLADFQGKLDQAWQDAPYIPPHRR